MTREVHTTITGRVVYGEKKSDSQCGGWLYRVVITGGDQPDLIGEERYVFVPAVWLQRIPPLYPPSIYGGSDPSVFSAIQEQAQSNQLPDDAIISRVYAEKARLNTLATFTGEFVEPWIELGDLHQQHVLLVKEEPNIEPVG